MTGYLALLILPYALAGGFWFRVRGGGWFDVPRIVDLTVWGLLVTLPVWFIGVPWYGSILSVAWVAALTSWGHGDFLDMGGRTGDPDEILAKLVTFLTGSSDGFWRDGLGMALSGLTYIVGPAIIAGVYASPWWLLWLLVGCLKGAAYLIGKKLWLEGMRFGPGHTVIAEYLTGGFMCAGSGLLWWGLG